MNADFFSQYCDGLRKIAGNGTGTQSLDGIATLGNRLAGLFDGAFERLLGFGGAVRKIVGDGVELQQQSLKAL